MAISKAFVAAALVLVAGGEPALAVDLPPVPSLPAEEASSGEFSGWYLRGDLGAGVEAAPELGAASVPLAAGLPSLSPFAISSFSAASLSPSGTVGAGLGYAFSPWLRMDTTLEYRFGARLRSSYAIVDSAPGGLPIFVGGLKAGVSSIVALVNGYVDLGAYWGVTPFVGGGVGIAENALSGVTDQGVRLAGPGAIAPAGGLFANASTTRFAWALTAGFDYDIAPNLKLEVSYRYLNLGPIAIGGAHCSVRAQACVGGASAAAPSRNALASSDLRIGLVWLIGELSAPRAPFVARD